MMDFAPRLGYHWRKETHMARFIASRTLTAALTILAASLIAFLVSRIWGDYGDPRYIYLSNFAGTVTITTETWSELGKFFYLDKPIPARFAYWLADMLSGDWRSVMLAKDYVQPAHIHDMALHTAKLGLASWAIAVGVGATLGVLSALIRATALDRAGRWLFLAGQAAPSFLVGVFGLALFWAWAGWFPLSEIEERIASPLYYYALPVIALASLPAIMYMRFARVAALDALDARLVAKACARGVGYGAIMRRYAARSVLASALEVTAWSLPWFLTGLVTVEYLFELPGIGQYVAHPDMWTKQIDPAAAMLFCAVGFAAAKLVLDILRRLADPKSEYAWQWETA